MTHTSLNLSRLPKVAKEAHREIGDKSLLTIGQENQDQLFLTDSEEEDTGDNTPADSSEGEGLTPDAHAADYFFIQEVKDKSNVGELLLGLDFGFCGGKV